MPTINLLRKMAAVRDETHDETDLMGSREPTQRFESVGRCLFQVAVGQISDLGLLLVAKAAGGKPIRNDVAVLL